MLQNPINATNRNHPVILNENNGIQLIFIYVDNREDSMILLVEFSCHSYVQRNMFFYFIKNNLCTNIFEMDKAVIKNQFS